MELSKLASAIFNDIKSGTAGMSANETMSLEQLEDECVEMRQAVIKEFYLKNLINSKDLLVAINCIKVDCQDQNKCCLISDNPKPAKHFEIPQLLDGLGLDAIDFVGSTDRSVSFKVYFDKKSAKYYKYRRKSDNKPYVYIEKTPNANNMYDCWVFNAPFVENICIIGVFKDLRQLEEFDCCNSSDYLDFGIISTEVKNRLIDKKLKLYRQYIAQPLPTNLTPR